MPVNQPMDDDRSDVDEPARRPGNNRGVPRGVIVGAVIVLVVVVGAILLVIGINGGDPTDDNVPADQSRGAVPVPLAA